jgi:hypothetical protein
VGRVALGLDEALGQGLCQVCGSGALCCAPPPGNSPSGFWDSRAPRSDN